MKSLLFDLDDTLYRAKSGIMEAISEKINEYMVSRLDVPPERVDELRTRFLEVYGTTVSGLMKEFNFNFRHFMEFVHDIDVDRCLKPNPAVNKMLEHIKNPKYVFSNGPSFHAKRVLKILGIEDEFLRIFDIDALDYTGKPAVSAYLKVVQEIGNEAPNCIMIENSIKNIETAKLLGMTTIWVAEEGEELLPYNPNPPRHEPPHWVDYVVRYVEDLVSINSDLFRFKET